MSWSLIEICIHMKKWQKPNVELIDIQIGLAKKHQRNKWPIVSLSEQQGQQRDPKLNPTAFKEFFVGIRPWSNLRTRNDLEGGI